MALKQMGILNLGSSMDNGLEKGRIHLEGIWAKWEEKIKTLSAQMKRRMNS